LPFVVEGDASAAAAAGAEENESLPARVLADLAVGTSDSSDDDGDDTGNTESDGDDHHLSDGDDGDDDNGTNGNTGTGGKLLSFRNARYEIFDSFSQKQDIRAELLGSKSKAKAKKQRDG
jgi:hypothetical protein